MPPAAVIACSTNPIRTAGGCTFRNRWAKACPFVSVALSDEILGIAIENVDVLGVDVDVLQCTPAWDSV
jgi:hypothetical protein